ncbi:uncharacterized protein LOC132936997 isoform X2 [Metopolophium dirhodum]|uniref:uncharacterized protein LOC132936997 isoform X2 n=1 Tax=Metopolophium dirhodum TaxID=44670 RepID=UPI0029906CC0|nr:uncharacterized protein LOC132936997 isoform X2 [Metopolophium dirhodum]
MGVGVFGRFWIHKLLYYMSIQQSLKSNGIAFVGFEGESREMTEKEVLLTKFFNDNFAMKSRSELYTPIDYCRKRNFGKSGILAWILRAIKSSKKEITKEYEDIAIIIEEPTKNGDAAISQTFTKDFSNSSESTKKTIEEQIKLWPESKQGYFNTLLEVIKLENESKEYWTKTEWCMKYYNLEQIQDSTSVTNPPL